MSWIFGGAAVLVVLAWLGYRRRLARLRDPLDDDAIRTIEERGWIQRDEPLDLQEAAEEEDQFWNETWDEPEPF